MASHKELIKSGKFGEKFKRTLLNYYNYGFKNLSCYHERTHGTISGDWLRLNNILSNLNYLEWSKNRTSVMFISADSQSMEENPFHRVYHFCRYTPFRYPAYFLHTMAALSPMFSLRGGFDALGLYDNQRIHLEDIEKNKLKLKTSDLVCYYPESIVYSEGADKNKTPNNRLGDLMKLGIIECEQYEGKKGGKGDRRWSLPGLTIRKLLDCGNDVHENFEQHLQSALDFFSRYYLFGEVGTYILDRFTRRDISPFRFKHEYFMQSLNDYNIIDLMHAIENGKWCKIKYCHGTADFVTDLLCYPLEIRISNMQGREYLIYYEPFKRSYTALRIEFIDSIEYFSDDSIKEFLVQNNDDISPETIESDILNARNAIGHSWGVATTKNQEGNAVRMVEPHEVSLKIAYDPDSEYYIRNRLKRERRFGMVSESDDRSCLKYAISVSDGNEMVPWIRSFYSRIISCEGLDAGDFSLEGDTKKIVNVLNNEKTDIIQAKLITQNHDRWHIPEQLMKNLGKSMEAKEHELIFNEFFSVYYYIIADVFVQLCASTEDKLYDETEIDDAIKCAFNKYYLMIGEGTKDILPSEIRELLFLGGFLEKKETTVKQRTGMFEETKIITKYFSKYRCKAGVEMYRDIIPLSTIEVRWLKTILHEKEQKIKLFMTDSEINALELFLQKYAPDAAPIPVNKIVYFDRFHFSPKNTKCEESVLTSLLTAIYDQRTVNMEYHTMRNRIIKGEFRPIVLEFSKRNNRFQGFFQECGSDRIYTMNISRIKEVSETDNSFDYDAAEQDFIKFKNDNTTFVEVLFYDMNNTVDRILTEFSPWKKRCLYDPETEQYKLKIFYQKQDEVDLVVRLLGYGSNLRFIDKEHPICKEIQSRVNHQMDLIRNHQMDKDIYR